MEQNEQTTVLGQEYTEPAPAPQAQPQQTEPQQPVSQQPVYQQPVYQQPVYQQPVYQQPVYQQPVYQQPVYQQSSAAQTAVDNSASAAFKKALAALIMAEFPIASIIAIFFAAAGLRHSKESNSLAARYGMRTNGKSIAAKVMGIIALIGSIFFTVFWAIYIFGIIFAISELTGGYYY